MGRRTDRAVRRRPHGTVALGSITPCADEASAEHAGRFTGRSLGA
ncbi:hypothetical protein [Streptomyces somaliensis]